MASEIRSIPVLTGGTAERFVREAEENEKNPNEENFFSHLMTLIKGWNVYENI
jgi:hypothetical protein|nr:hypothetical protein [uncultured Prevotella sp.]